MSRFVHHIFVCVNARPLLGRPSCAARGGEALAAALERAALADERLVGRIAVTRCGCLGPCFDGPNLVIYPDATWYAGATVEDVGELVESHLVKGTPLDRLLFHWPSDDYLDEDDSEGPGDQPRASEKRSPKPNQGDQ